MLFGDGSYSTHIAILHAIAFPNQRQTTMPHLTVAHFFPLTNEKKPLISPFPLKPRKLILKVLIPY